MSSCYVYAILHSTERIVGSHRLVNFNISVRNTRRGDGDLMHNVSCSHFRVLFIVDTLTEEPRTYLRIATQWGDLFVTQGHGLN